MKWRYLILIFLLPAALMAQSGNAEVGRYYTPTFEVKETLDLHYATVMGYWSDLKDETAATDMVLQLGQVLSERSLDLYLDVYSPIDETMHYHPLVMLIHGGAFYYGSRKDEAITLWCKHLASLGYVAVSIDYRIGFQPTLVGIERAGYRAVQDAHAAMRYLVQNNEHLGIDTSMMFAGGSSAGAITALNLMYMNDTTRPSTSYAGFLKEDLGNLESSGNRIQCTFDLKGVVDMWGAISDIHLMDGNTKPVIALHGNIDNIVPYDYDYPFQMAGDAKKLLFNKMYGSSCIIDYAKRQGALAELYTFRGYQHSPHYDKKTKKLNKNFYFIQDKMEAFFRKVMEKTHENE